MKPLKTKSLQTISAAKTLKILQSDESAINVLLDLVDEQLQVLLPHYFKTSYGYWQSTSSTMARSSELP